MSDPHPLAGEPILVFVHGTGDGPTIDDSAAFDQLETLNAVDWADLFDESGEQMRSWISGDRWWQVDGVLSARLGQRVVSKSGVSLMKDEMVLRFLWRGDNDEEVRNNAAHRLEQVLANLAHAERRVHILAHSHGGNVVRRALELGSANPRVCRSIVSITCFGTPFFRYATTAIRTAFCLNLLMFVLLIPFFWIAKHWIGKAAVVWLGIPVVLYFFIAGGRLLGSVFDLFIDHRRCLHIQAENIIWKNYCSARDEAVGLLSSFNTRIPLMQNASDPGRSGSTRLQILAFGAIVVGLDVVTNTVQTSFKRLVGLPIDAHPEFSVLGAEAWATQLLSFGVAVAAAAAVVAGYLAAKRAAKAVVDQLVTLRLRSLAYGDEKGRIVGVDTAPWPGHDRVTHALPADVEAALEAHIRLHTSGLWANLRTGLAPHQPLLAQNIAKVVLQTLTWNELAHTVYGRVESFSDLLACDLVETGDWAWREPNPSAATKPS